MKRRNMVRAHRLRENGTNVAKMRAYVMSTAYNTIAFGRSVARRYAERSDDHSARIDLTMGQWIDLCESYDYLCAYCGKPPMDSLNRPRLSMDHVEPLHRGGGHTIENVVPCCPRCNSSKGQLTLMEWACVEVGLWTASRGRTRGTKLRDPFGDVTQRGFDVFWARDRYWAA